MIQKSSQNPYKILAERTVSVLYILMQLAEGILAACGTQKSGTGLK